MQKMQTSKPEVLQGEMKKWMDWFGGLGDKVVDMGDMFRGGASVSSDGWSDVDEGSPTGFSIIQADSLDSAKKLVNDHPHVAWFEGCRVDVFEQMQMPDKN